MAALLLVLVLVSAACCDPVKVEVLVHQAANVTLNLTEEVSAVMLSIIFKYCLFSVLWYRSLGALLVPGVLHHLPRHGALPQLPHPARQADTIRDAALWILSG